MTIVGILNKIFVFETNAGDFEVSARDKESAVEEFFKICDYYIESTVGKDKLIIHNVISR